MELQVYDVFCMVFLDRPGAYFRLDQVARTTRGRITAELIITQLRTYHRLLHGTQREGPEVVWHGELTVLDGSVFSTRLASGVGRHAAYGFGMLLLRPTRLEDGYVGGTTRP